jgi:Trypsin-co-occurring domain 1
MANEKNIVLGGFYAKKAIKKISETTEDIGKDIFAQIGKNVGAWTKEFLECYQDEASKKTPSEISVEFGIKIKAEGNFIQFVKAGSEADIKLKLLWKSD